METAPLDVSQMSFKAIQRLTDAELAPVIRAGYQEMNGREISQQNLDEAIDAVRHGYWAYGLPAPSSQKKPEPITVVSPNPQPPGTIWDFKKKTWRPKNGNN